MPLSCKSCLASGFKGRPFVQISPFWRSRPGNCVGLGNYRTSAEELVLRGFMINYIHALDVVKWFTSIIEYNKLYKSIKDNQIIYYSSMIMIGHQWRIPSPHPKKRHHHSVVPNCHKNVVSSPLLKHVFMVSVWYECRNGLVCLESWCPSEFCHCIVEEEVATARKLVKK